MKQGNKSRKIRKTIVKEIEITFSDNKNNTFGIRQVIV